MTAILLFPLLILATAFEIVKRVVGLVVYPVAYWCRTWPRKSKGLLWLFLDDSINADALRLGKAPCEYCVYGKREPLGFITENLPACWFTEFLRAYSWGCLRNNAINLAIVLENAVGPVKDVFAHYGNKSFYEVRVFKNVWLPYTELWFGKYRLQCGWLSCGRFQAQFTRKG